MQPRNPEFEREVRDIFKRANFVRDLGIEVTAVGVGTCSARLPLTDKHLQHGGIVHAGVQATLADHTAGAAATTLAAADEVVLSAEFKLNLLRPAEGDFLEAEAVVLKPGRRLIVVESWVYAIKGEHRRLTAKMTATMAAIPRSPTS